MNKTNIKKQIGWGVYLVDEDNKDETLLHVFGGTIKPAKNRINKVLDKCDL